MIVRVRTRVGMWRQEAQPCTKLSEFIANLEHEKQVKILRVSKEPNFNASFEKRGASTLDELGIKHGDILHIDATGATSSSSGQAGLVGTGPKSVDSHGNIVSADQAGSGAFRPGLQSLRTQKLHWTLTDMVEFDNKYTFEVKGEQKSFCSSASLDGSSLNNFQQYLRNFQFKQCRCAYLYGRFVPGDEIPGSVEEQKKKQESEKPGLKPTNFGKKKMELSDLEVLVKEDQRPSDGVIVDAIYEPLQQTSGTEFLLLEDPREEKVEMIADALGLQKVGFLFSHPPREGYHFSTLEIINAGEQALEATEGKKDSAFVIVKLTSEDGNASFDAFSLTPQCLEMVAEDALLHMPENPGHAAVNETFTLIVEKKEAHVVDNDFFIKRVPILSHCSPFAGEFPRFNREGISGPSFENLRLVLQKLGRSPSDVQIGKALADFQILIYLGEIFDRVEELVEIVKFVKSCITPGSTPIPLSEGYRVVIFASAGIEI